MYGKIFDSIYDGTLADDWRALITFQQLIVLCDADGNIDMTPTSISRRTGIPIEHIKAGIEILEKPDRYSRTPNEEGRRIELIDEHRPWGWHIVNHDVYKKLQDSDTVRSQTRERVKKHRESKKKAASCDESVTDGNAGVTDGNGQKRYTDTDTDTDINTNKEKKKVIKKNSPSFRLSAKVDKTAWRDFDKHRNRTAKLKKGWSDQAKTIAANILSELTPEEQQSCVNKSIIGDYAGLFPDKKNNSKAQPLGGKTSGKMGRAMKSLEENYGNSQAGSSNGTLQDGSQEPRSLTSG